MEKRQKWIIGGVAVGLSALTLITALLVTKNNNPEIPDLPNGATTTDETISLEVEQQSITQESETSTIDISYPQFESNSTIASSINTQITREIDSIQKSFNQYSGELDDFAAQNGFKNSLNIGYEEIVTGRNTISTPFLVSEYSAGAAHPNNYIRTLTFDKKTGERLTLSDLFSSDDYLEQLSLKSREELASYSVDGEDLELDQFALEQGTVPNEQNFQEFVLGDDTLTIIFNPYQVAPYAVGVVEVEIPFEELEGFRF